MSGFGQSLNAPGTVPGQSDAAADAQFTTPVFAGLGGAALAVLGSFMTWTSAEYDGMTETIGGMDGEGMWTLILAVLAGVLFGVGLVRRHLMIVASAAVPALIALVFAVLNAMDPERLARKDAEDEGATSEMIDAAFESIEFSTGFGLWMVVLGTLVAVGAAAYAGVRGRAAS